MKTDAMTPDPALWQRISDSFDRQGLMRHWGARLLTIQAGRVEIELPYGERVTQQQGGFHGGAIGALADICAGYAALTMAAPGLEVTTVEYKINFLAAFAGGHLVGRGEVVRAGRRVIVSSARVVHVDDHGQESDCALMQATIAPIPKTD
ncbi:MAG: PaaI family thioesterase [Alphaproteobacteria bacterium]|nr:PaaI family thioesterase [Alphaproteobacteria bacterium]